MVRGSRTVYFPGDTDLFAGMGDLVGADVALLPVWGWGPNIGPGHMDPIRAAEAASRLKPTLAVPIHWGTLYPLGLRRVHPRPLADPGHQFASAVASSAPGVSVRVLAPGESLSLPRLTSPLRHTGDGRAPPSPARLVGAEGEGVRRTRREPRCRGS